MKNSRGLWALTPMMLLVAMLLFIGIVAKDFYKVPLLVVFIIMAAYAILITWKNPETGKTLSVNERISIFAKGAGDSNLIQMILIFTLAGAFAHSAKQMGAIDAMVNFTLSFVPSSLLLLGLFIAALAVSLGIGTSVGTIVAITPFAAGISASTTYGLGMTVAAVVGGALFGDNLSFISDTTIVATNTQGIGMRQKFLANFKIALPAAIITAIIYGVIGFTSPETAITIGDVNYWNIIPYLFVLVASIAGMHVLLVLLCACVLVGIVGAVNGTFTPLSWMGSMAMGIEDMSELILISLIAGGALELIKYNGGIDWIISVIDRHVHSAKGASLAIALLVVLVDICCANNTIAILSVGSISREIADKYGVSRKRAASILDTFSCCSQGFLPYGAQLLMAAGIAGCTPLHFVPFLFYPMILFVVALGAIFVAKD